MSTLQAALLLFGILFLLILLKLPIAYALLASSILTLFLSGIPLQMATQRIVASLDSFSLMAVPFFILAGSLMGAGGISDRLIAFANAMVGHLSGGLAIVSIVACMFFAAISGSGAATVAAVGGIMMPYMTKYGYDRSFSAAVNAAAGGIGIIIPPSIPFVSYAIITGASVTELFTGGITAGFLVGLCLMITVMLLSKKRAFPRLKKATWKKRGETFLKAIPALLMPFIILGGIYSGLFTAVESSVVAVVYALFVGAFLYKGLNRENIFQIFLESAKATAQILFLIANATLFAWLLTHFRIADLAAQSILSLTENPIVILLLMNLLLFFMGTFMDTVASILIVTPILYPIAMELGMDPVHLGVFMCSNLAIGQITPPFGVNLFVASGIGKTSFEDLVKELLPLILAMLMASLLITFIEPLSMFFVHGMRAS